MSGWLFKSEPDTFGIDHLEHAGANGSCWDGVRNFQARNYLRDEVQINDKVFIYHSSCQRIGIAGVARVLRSGYPDPTQFDPSSAYFDAKSTPEHPRWFAVDVVFESRFTRVLPLSVIKQLPDMMTLPLVKKGHRLSVMPVSAQEWDTLLAAASTA